jgi:hypothetical protein
MNDNKMRDLEEEIENLKKLKGERMDYLEKMR